MSRLVCTDVSASYNGAPVLDAVSFSVGPGEWVGLIGPNGAGKSTLLRAVAGMTPWRGEISVDGDTLSGVSRRESARRVAVVPQTPMIPDAMPVVEYVLLGRTPFISYWGSETNADLRIVEDILTRLDLGELAERPMGSLSGGERQRAVLARALAQEAGVLLLDEPTTALDLGHQQRVLSHVDELRHDQGIAVLSALHDLTLAAQYPDRLVLLVAGTLVADGPANEVLTPEHLSRYYRAAVSVVRDDTGSLIVAPRKAQINVESTSTPIQ